MHQGTKANELNSEKETVESVSDPLLSKSDVPLFLRDSSEDQKNDDQDEKDNTAE